MTFFLIEQFKKKILPKGELDCDREVAEIVSGDGEHAINTVSFVQLFHLGESRPKKVCSLKVKVPKYVQG